MDKLDKEIEEKTRERDVLRDRVEALRAQIEDATRKHAESAATLREYEIELRALNRAASLRPGGVVVAPTPPETAEPRRGGRQRGSISKKWRGAMADLVGAGNQPIEHEQFYLLTRGRLGLAEASVKERVRQYVSAGHLEEVGGRLRVSQEAIAKFGLDKSPPRDDDDEDDADDEPETYPHVNGVSDNEKASH